MSRKKPHQNEVEPQKRAAIYLRVSTEDQADTGFGLDVQRRRCRAMVEVKGWSLIGEYADEGISGTKDERARPQLAALLDAARGGEVDAVIVLALDRLGRKTRIVLHLVEEFTDAGAILVSCNESLDTSTPQGQFVLTMFAALAQLDRDLIVRRTTSGRNERGMKDGERGGTLPYGYKRTEQGLVVDKSAAAIVRRIFTLRRKGASLRAIAAQLTTPAPRGGPWYAPTVASILGNEAIYRGGQRGESPLRWPRIL